MKDISTEKTALPAVVPIKKTGIGPRPECFKSTVQEILFALMSTMAIAMGSFLEGATTVITATVGKKLDMTSTEITWIAAASALTAGSFLLFFSKVADTFGRNKVLIFSFGAFAISNLITGFAYNALYLDILNGILGLWCAASVPSAIGILGAAYSKPSRRKNLAFAGFSAGNPVGFVFGSISSGIATQVLGWRASFFFLAIIYAICFVITIFTIPDTNQVIKKLNTQTMKEFDIIGTFLSMTGLATFCCALSIAADAPRGWATNYIIALLVLGVVCFVAFLLWEGKYKYPLMPLSIWKDKNFVLVNSIVLLGFMSFTSSGFWLSLFMQRVQGHSPLSVAVRLLPEAIAGLLVNIVAGLTLHNINNKLIMGVGTLAYTISSILLSLMSAESSYWAFIFPSIILSVIGADMQFNVANMYVMSSLPDHQQSLGGGVFNTVVKICITLGLAISTSIYNGTSTTGTSLVVHPYTMCFWFSVACSGLGLLLVPFLSIGTQGNEVFEEQSVRSEV